MQINPNRMSYSMQQLMSVQHKFNSLPSEFNAYDELVNESGSSIHKLLCGQKSLRTSYSLKQLLSVRDKYKSLPSELALIPNILDKGLGVNPSNMSITKEKIEAIESNKSVPISYGKLIKQNVTYTNPKKSEISGIDMVESANKLSNDMCTPVTYSIAVN